MDAPPERVRRQVSSGLMAAAREAEAEERLDDKKNSELLSAAAKTLTADEAGDETSHILRQLSTEMHESEERGAEASEPIRAPTEASARRGRGASEEQDGDDDEDIDVARALRSAAQEVVREEQGQENNGDHTEDAYADDGADYSLSSDEGGSGGEGSGGEEEVDAEKDKELIQCCARGESSRVSKLLRGGARLLCRDGHGWTPMHWASSRGHVAVINELLDACPNSRLKRLVAVVAGHLPCVKLLLDNSAKAYSHNSMGETPRDCIPFDRASTEYKDMVSALGPPPPPRASSSSSSNRHAKRTGPHRMDGAAAGSNNDSRSATAAKFAEIAGARK